MKTRMLLSIVFLLCASIILAQGSQVKGTIYEEDTGDPLPFVNVMLTRDTSTVSGSYTDFDGRFMMRGVPPGIYSLKASYVGYFNYTTDSLVVRKGNDTTLRISMKASSVTLECIEVMAYRVPLISRDQTTSGASVSSAGISSVRGSRASAVGGVDGVFVPDHTQVSDFSGLLTASELNDFSKWALWSEARDRQLGKYRGTWKLYPEERYQVQVTDKDGNPVINAKAVLPSNIGTEVWAARTDNTGKAELWDGLFEKGHKGKLQIEVIYEGQTYYYRHPHRYPEGINALQLPESYSYPDRVEIAFVVDATGSMTDEIKFLQSDLMDIMGKVRQSFPGLEIRLGSVFYRCLNNSYVTKTSPLSKDIGKAIDFVSKQRAGEGGPEAVEEALASAVDSLGWSDTARTRILFLVLDQQPLTKPDIIGKMNKYIIKAAEKGIRIVPVVASAEELYLAASMEYLMRSIALATNGTYVFLTDHSNIGNEHAKPVTDRFEVELLNSLLKRLIYQYCYVPSEEEAAALDTVFVSSKVVLATEILDSLKVKDEILPKTYMEYFHLNLVERQGETSQEEAENAAPEDEKGATVQDEIFMKIYPNPTTGKFRVQLYSKVNELYLFDLSGKLMMKIRSDRQEEVNVDISNFSSGLYFLKFSVDGQWYSGKVILNR